MAKKNKKKAAKKAAKKRPVKKAAKKSPKKAAKKPAKKAAKKVAPKSVTPVKRMPAVNPYLTFAGNCEAAFNHYRSVFGGNFTFMGRFNEMPPQEGQPPMSEEMGKLIMHVSLPIGNSILMGSDTDDNFSAGPLVQGTNFSVSVSAVSQAEADKIYAGLSEGGTPFMPMSKTFWGSYFGMCKDKFGITWMVSYDEPKA